MTAPGPTQPSQLRLTRPIAPPPVPASGSVPGSGSASATSAAQADAKARSLGRTEHESAQAKRLSGKREPSFPAETLRVTTLADPVLDRLGHDPRSTYVERFWLPVLGPSCLLLLRRLAAELEQQPDGFTLTTAQWAREMGVGMKGGKNGPLWRAVERACRFGAAQRNGELLAVRRRLPPLTARQVERLPTELREAHSHWVEERQSRPRQKTVTKWSSRRDQIGRPLPAVASDASTVSEKTAEVLTETVKLDDAA